MPSNIKKPILSLFRKNNQADDAETDSDRTVSEQDYFEQRRFEQRQEPHFGEELFRRGPEPENFELSRESNFIQEMPLKSGQFQSVYETSSNEYSPMGNETGTFKIKEGLSAFGGMLKKRRSKVKVEKPELMNPSINIQPNTYVRAIENAPSPLFDTVPAQPKKQKPKPSIKREYDDEAGWLVAQNLQKSFRRRSVVRNVTLAVRQGEAVGLLGPNGAGKTTVFYMITGLIRPDKGSIRIDGRTVTKLPMYARARLGIGYLPQEPSIFRGLTVEGNIKAILEIVEPNRRQRKEDLERLLEEFGLTALRKSPSIALSGGERRRCEIARALASRPSFILLDEPFAGIDPIAVGDIQKLVHQLTARGIGVLITDHNVRETLGLIDRAYIIHSGEVLMEGTPHDIVKSQDVRRVYLGDEFTL